jgi:RNA recognition motif-containing protein
MIMRHQDSGRPRGFGFVTMEGEDGASVAMEVLNGQEFDGRILEVNIAYPKANDEEKEKDENPYEMKKISEVPKKKKKK